MAGSSNYTPPPSPPSPTASFYDVSDDEEDEYNTIAHAKSGRGVKLLFSKSKVVFSFICLVVANWWSIGLCPSDAIVERQYPRLYRLDPTEAAAGPGGVGYCPKEAI